MRNDDQSVRSAQTRDVDLLACIVWSAKVLERSERASRIMTDRNELDEPILAGASRARKMPADGLTDRDAKP